MLEPDSGSMDMGNNVKAAVVLGFALLVAWAGMSFASVQEIQWGQDGWRLLAGSVTLALATLYVLTRLSGLRPALRFMAAALAISWLAEVVGLHGNWLFGGAYTYAPGVQPVLPGGVPLFIPPSWFVVAGMSVMLLRSWKTAGSWLRRGLKAAVGALGAVACDLALDPVAVAVGLWTWESPGVYFGIPALNFAGWWLVAFLILLTGCEGPPVPGRGAAARVPIRFDLAWSGTNGLLLVLLICTARQRLGSQVPILASFLALLPLLAIWHRELYGKIKACRYIRSPI